VNTTAMTERRPNHARRRRASEQSNGSYPSVANGTTISVVETVGPSVQLVFHGRDFRFYAVSAAELAGLERSEATLPSAFFATFFGASVPIGIEAFATKTSPIAHIGFAWGFIATTCLALFYALQTVLAWRRRRNVLADIRGRPVEFSPLRDLHSN
jgi:hypothetical protein